MNHKDIPLEQLETDYQQGLSKLQPLQARFIEEYLIDLNATEAAKRAGYSPKTAYNQGSRLCRKQKISSLISLAIEARSRRTQTTQDWVLLNLRDQFDKASGEKNRSSATRCLELIGKHLGMFSESQGKDEKHLHLHQDKYVNYPPVPDTVKEWVDQMNEIEHEKDSNMYGIAKIKGEDNGNIIP